jgi:cell wall-associated NlpC family hydrolase
MAPEAHAYSAGAKALKVAAAKKGAPYRWGAKGPGSFDCSGLTYYAFRKAGKKLPRTAAAQYNRVRHISRSTRRPGDLVFFHAGPSVYHVGIYAGKGKIWHSPKPGRKVRKERIWTSNVLYGRVR